MPKPPASLVASWIVTYAYAFILWAVEFSKKDIAGKMVASTPAGFWYTMVIGGLILGLIIGVYLAESLSRRPAGGG
ncbi:MAG: hypothetical protein LRS49_06515 [Desulfurococcales archaeon]|nr:hypothetical protein [Desulfurococcales archaeon]